MSQTSANDLLERGESIKENRYQTEKQKAILHTVDTGS